MCDPLQSAWITQALVWTLLGWGRCVHVCVCVLCTAIEITGNHEQGAISVVNKCFTTTKMSRGERNTHICNCRTPKYIFSTVSWHWLLRAVRRILRYSAWSICSSAWSFTSLTSILGLQSQRSSPFPFLASLVLWLVICHPPPFDTIALFTQHLIHHSLAALSRCLLPVDVSSPSCSAGGVNNHGCLWNLGLLLIKY